MYVYGFDDAVGRNKLGDYFEAKFVQAIGGGCSIISGRLIVVGLIVFDGDEKVKLTGRLEWLVDFEHFAAFDHRTVRQLVLAYVGQIVDLSRQQPVGYVTVHFEITIFNAHSVAVRAAFAQIERTFVLLTVFAARIYVSNVVVVIRRG